MNDLSDYELGWLVGILEGEGCFSIGMDKRRKHREKKVRVQLQMGDAEIIAKLIRITGLGNVGGPYKTRSKVHTPMWGWNLGHDDSLQIMALVYDHMSARRKARIAEVVAGC